MTTITITINENLEQKVSELAQQLHSSAEDIVTSILAKYFTDSSSSDTTNSFSELAKELPTFSCFGNQDPLAMQQTMRNEWN